MVGRNGACTVVHNNVKIRDKQIKKKRKTKQETGNQMYEFRVQVRTGVAFRKEVVSGADSITSIQNPVVLHYDFFPYKHRLFSYQ